MADQGYYRPSGADFRIGAVFGRSFRLFSSNFVMIFAAAAIPGAIYFGLMFLLGYHYGPVIARASAGRVDWGSLPVFVGISIVLSVVYTVVTRAAVLYGVFELMRGRPYPFGESFSRGLSRFLPVLGLSILAGLGIMFGMLLLLVPGFMLICTWYVGLQACVVERMGPGQALSRSAELTRGYRWRVFGIIILLGIVVGIIGQVIGRVAGASGSIAAVLIVQYAWQTLYTAFDATLAAVVYHDLRVAKEGIDIERIASVFD